LGLQKPEQLTPSLKTYAASYEQWFIQQISKGTLAGETLVPLEQRKVLLADWLRHLVTTKQLAPHERVPMHADLGETFGLSTSQVAKVVLRLRQGHVLAPHHPRSDAGQPRWNERDDYALWWIGKQRAVRYDQGQRILARASNRDPQNPLELSRSRTTQIIQRWQKAHLIEYRKIYVHQPGWIWLTRKGLAFVGLEYRAGIPAESSLTHLYYINEVRLLLESMYEDNTEFTWISERALLHGQKKMRIKSHLLPHTPDATVIIGKETIDIEVELTRKPQREIECTMRGVWESARSTNALRYYVSRQAQATVQAAWKNIERSYRTVGYRPWVEIVALDDVFK
jgi:hypothetical protein